MKHLMTTTALGLFVATAPFAQTEGDTTPYSVPETAQVTDNPSKVTVESQEATDAAQSDILTDDDTVVDEETGGDMGIEEQGGDVAARTTLDTSELIAKDLVGAPVYDSSNNEIGEITSVITDDNGAINQAVVGMGGIFGMGRREYALPVTDIEIRQGEDEYMVFVSMTSDELSVMPLFEG